MPKVKVWQLDPADGSPGQVPKINDDGSEAEWADAAGSSAGALVPVTSSLGGDLAFAITTDFQLILVEVPL